MIDKLLEGNKKFVETEYKENINRFKELESGQSPHSLVITCSDSRVCPEMIFSAGPGEIFVHRNIGNLVPEDEPNIATVLEYAVDHLKVNDIIILGHSECGAMKALMADPHGEYIPGWLKNAEEVLKKVNDMDLPSETDEDKKKVLTEIEVENTKRQTENLKKYRIVKDGIENGSLKVFGVYYKLETGEAELIC